MTRTDPILEQDIAIGQYTLGLLPPKEHARLQALLSSDPAAARSALRWEESFLALVDALPQAQPPHALLENVLTALDLPLPVGDPAPRITAAPSLHSTDEPKRMPAQRPLPPSGSVPAAAVTIDPPGTPEGAPARIAQPIRPVHHVAAQSPHNTPQEPAPKSPGQGRPSRRAWMGGTAIALVLIGLLTLIFIPSKPAEPPVVIVEVAPSKGAILQAPGQSSTPGWVVTVDLENNVTLTPQVHTETPADASVQLWTYNKALPQPRSLGLIDPNQPVAVPADIMGTIGDDQFFEMTLEPEGGSPTSEPTGPILFIGRVVTFS